MNMLMCVGVSCSDTPGARCWEIDFNLTKDRGRVIFFRFPRVRRC